MAAAATLNITAGTHAPNSAASTPTPAMGADNSEASVAAMVGTVAPPSVQEGSFIGDTLGQLTSTGRRLFW